MVLVLVAVIKLSPPRRFLIREGHDLLRRLFMYFISILFAEQITKIFPTFKVKLYSLKICESVANVGSHKHCPLLIVSNKKYDKWHPLRWARLACRHGRQPRLDQDRDVIRDVRSTVCAY